MKLPRPPVVADRRVALVGGWALFVIGAWLLWDAYEGHGSRPPWPLGAVMPW